MTGMTHLKRIALALAAAACLVLSACSPGAQPSASSGTSTPSMESPSPSPTAMATPSPEDSATTEPADTPAPTDTPVPDDTLYVARVKIEDSTSWLKLRSQPDLKSVVLGCIPDGSEVTIAVMGDEWSKLLFEDDFAYTMTKFLQVERALNAGETPPPLQLLYASLAATRGTYTPAPSPSGTGPAPTAEILKDNLVDVRRYCPNAVFCMIFATEDNIMGRPLYVRKVCLLQKETAAKLKKAEDLFEKDGYRIKIYDAYRPMSVSAILYKKYKDNRFIAPAGSSSHNRGAAVDITLVDSNGDELEMQSAVHDLSENAYINNPKASAAAKKNYKYLSGIMKKCGFTTYQYEWWHFTDTNKDKYLPTDYKFMTVQSEGLVMVK
jgi:D-alanyl-D-alanine dipeptidase